MSKKSPFQIRVRADYFGLISAFISDNDNRHTLEGVCIEPHPVKGVLLIATDGHTMGVIHDETGHCDPDAKGTIIAATKDVVKACKADREAANMTDVVRSVTLAKAGLVVGEVYEDAILPQFSQFVKVTGAVIDGTFPEWRRVVPREAEGGFATYDPDLLAGFKFPKFWGFQTQGMTVFTNGESGPALVRVAGLPEFAGVIMPMKGDNDPAKREADWLIAALPQYGMNDDRDDTPKAATERLKAAEKQPLDKIGVNVGTSDCGYAGLPDTFVSTVTIRLPVDEHGVVHVPTSPPPATKRQLWALYRITGVDHRGLNLSKAEAAARIQDANEQKLAA